MPRAKPKPRPEAARWEPPFYLSVDQVAALAGVSGRFVRDEIRKGALRAYHPTASLVRVSLSDMRRWIEAHPVQPVSTDRRA